LDSPCPKIDMLEASLKRLRGKLPAAPISEIMLSRLLLNVGRHMAAHLERQIRPFGLAEAEFRVLTTLFSLPEGVAHPSDLCARTSQSPANMSRISDALVSRELITRVLSEQDRRRMVLRITEPGEDLVRRLLPQLFAPLTDLFADIGEADQQRLIGQLKAVAMKLDARVSQEPAEQDS
jgi:MarR family transcriptional regulator, negative regulator of the multidrug operon emrRAB